MKVRPVTDADVPALVALLNEATPENPIDEADLRNFFASPEDVAAAVVETDGGELLAYADLYGQESAADRFWADPRIPARTLTDEVATLMFEWMEATALERGRPLLRVAVPAGSPLAGTLAKRGYAPIRFFFHMRIDLDGPPPAPEWPEGIEVETVRPGEERAVHDAAEEAFADHWEFAPHPFESFLHELVEAEDFDPSLWFVAREGDQIAGVSLCRPLASGRPGVGWVRVLAVRRPWRRRGLALALLLQSFGAFWERGTHSVGLGVDGENTTGAVRLYERAGMHVEHRFDTYEREIASGVGSTEPPGGGAGSAGAGAGP
jgi:mycothiol synthase